MRLVLRVCRSGAGCYFFELIFGTLRNVSFFFLCWMICYRINSTSTRGLKWGEEDKDENCKVYGRFVLKEIEFVRVKRATE